MDNLSNQPPRVPDGRCPGYGDPAIEREGELRCPNCGSFLEDDDEQCDECDARSQCGLPRSV